MGKTPTTEYGHVPEKVKTLKDLYNHINKTENEMFLKSPSDMLLKDNKLWISASGLSDQLEQFLRNTDKFKVRKHQPSEDYSEEWVVR